MKSARKQNALLITALAPVAPQILGSIFNIWYNLSVVHPLLVAANLTDRFVHTVVIWNAIVYPIAIAAWLWQILSIRPAFHRLLRGENVPSDELDSARRRLVHLPWAGAAISGVAWLLGAAVFPISLSLTGHSVDPQLYWQLPISFAVSGFIALTQSFFLIEWTSQWALYPTFFQDARPDRLERIHPISLRTRGLMWVISTGICPIASLLLLIFAPVSTGEDPRWFGLFVGLVGIMFGVFSALLIGRSVTEPVDELRAAAQAVTGGTWMCRCRCNARTNSVR